MNYHEKIKPYIKHLKIISLTGASIIASYKIIRNTNESVKNIVNTAVLKREKLCSAEYIYIDDPLYKTILLREFEKESTFFSRYTPYFLRNLRPSLTWRLLLFCKFGNPEQRDSALEQLAMFKHNKDWDCRKIAQAIDMNTAVLLARTEGADVRYFLPAPVHIRRAARSSELLCFKFRDILYALQSHHPHICIKHFLSKYFVNILEQAIEADIIPSKPHRMSDRDLCFICLKALFHHFSIFGCDDCEDDSIYNIITRDLLPNIAELFLRFPNDTELEAVILKVLTVISVDKKLLLGFFQNGLIRELSRLIKMNDISISSSAAVCLSNLSGECTYKPGLFLLHPKYRTSAPTVCDILLVHGLRGGVFVTWRQRDPKCFNKSLHMIEESVDDCDLCRKKTNEVDVKKIIEEEMELKTLLENLEIVLQDLPEKALRDTQNVDSYLAHKKRLSLAQEEQDQCHYTTCWPQEWLPKDFKNLRILGVNYWSSFTDWLERCPLQSGDIASRAYELEYILNEAKVGVKHTPVVWLAHSMGGLIVKQLLVSSDQSQWVESKKLSANTKAVVFFSTPHKGSSLAAMPRAAAAVFWPSSDVKQLKDNSPLLLELQNDFLKAAEKYNWETISFSESKPTLVTAFKVPFHLVKPESGDLGRGPFYQMPLDHLTICKPASRQSILYKTVLDAITRATKDKISVEQIEYYFDIPWLWFLEL